MYWVSLCITAIAATALIIWPLLRGAPFSSRRSPLLWTFAIVAPLLALGTEHIVLPDVQDDALARSLGLESIAWSGSPATASEAPVEPATSVAPVSALIDGLKTRLDREPEDAKGWALLAQSYAFINDEQRAEDAIVKAVGLGFDEADLRHRVELALQSSQAPNQAAGAASAPGIVHGVVTLAPDIDLELSTEHRLFVTAKAINGSAMPVAVIQRQVREFPFTFALTDSESVTPWASITDLDEVAISARLSASGTAETTDKDIQSNTEIVSVASPEWVELTIGG